MTRVLPAAISSNVAVVIGPLALSSLVQTRRAFGATSRYLPKNGIGAGALGWRISSRYPPPTRTSILHDTIVMPIDLGAHQRWNSSGLVHASNTSRADPLMIRVVTSSRSDVCLVVVSVLIGMPFFLSV